MTDRLVPPYGDPPSQPFWAAAWKRVLMVQCCRDFGGHQFYPRPFCLACQSDDISWQAVNGTGRVYSMTEVHMAPGPEFMPPYYVAAVELDEGPRLVNNLIGSDRCIGDPVRVTWRDRDGAPPLPLFEKAGSAR